MEKTIYMKTKARRLHLIMAAAFGGLFITALITFILSDTKPKVYILIFPAIMTLSQLTQYLLTPNWIVKYDEDKLIINQHFFAKKIQVNTKDLESKRLITGDIEINLGDKSHEISKDLMEEEDYDALLNHLQLS